MARTTAEHLGFMPRNSEWRGGGAGVIGDTAYFVSGNWNDNVQIYNMATDTLTQGAQLPDSLEWGTELNGKVYSAARWWENSMGTARIYSYDMAGDSFSHVDTSIPADGRPNVVAVGGLIYVLTPASGGYEFWTYNPTNNNVTQVQTPPVSFSRLATDGTDIFTRTTSTSGSGPGWYKYTVATDDWSYLGSTTSNIHQATPIIYKNGYFYVIGYGISGSGLITVFNPETAVEQSPAVIEHVGQTWDRVFAILNAPIVEYGSAFYTFGSTGTTIDNQSYSSIYRFTPSTVPAAPDVITSPAEGDIWGGTHTILWTNIAEADTYQLRLSKDGASTWGHLADDVPTNSLEHNFYNESSSSAAVIRVRSRGTEFHSQWTESDVFSINSPPNAPALTTRTNFDAANNATFAWSFSDPNPGQSQTAYQLVIESITGGAVAFDSGKVVSGSESRVLAGGTIANGQQYRWRVRTWDDFDTAGSYSEWSTFYASAKPTVTILNPANDGDEINGPSLVIDWAFSDPEAEPQRAYRLVLTNETQGSTIFDTGKIMDSVNTQRQVDSLEDSQDYRIAVTMWDAKDIPSDTVYRTFSTVFLPPVGGYVSAQDYGDHIAVFINNPEPAGDAADTAANDLYRREPGGEWIRIATNLSKNGYYDDYAVASGQRYEYYAISRSEEGLTATTSTDYATLNISGVWLHDPLDPSGTIYKFEFDGAGRSESWSPEVQMLNYSGRAMPVAEFGRQTDQTVGVTLQLANPGDEKAIRDLAMRRTTLCYRDGRGRKLFGVITALPISETKWGSTVELTVHGVSLNEEV